MTEGLARAGVTVVGGVNEGPEGIAHEGALAGAGRSIAVMACSPDLSHLTRQDSLHQRILAAGAAVSEFPPGFFQPQRWSFIASRRIVPALADVVVIVEAGGFTHSALSTKIAVELGRDIAVVPGRVTDPSGERILRLLQDGAHPVASAEHVLEVLNGAGLRGPALHDPAPHELADGAGVPGPAIHDPALHGVAA
jgi:DNA processing protein